MGVKILPRSEAIGTLDMLGVAGGVARRIETAVRRGEVTGHKLVITLRPLQLLAVILEHPWKQNESLNKLFNLAFSQSKQLGIN